MNGMHTPLRATVLACSFIMVSCGSVPASDRSAPASGAFAAAEVPGTWSLTDDENVTFDVVLSAEGTAVSNWSKGPQGAQGEEGRWSLKDGCIEIDYTDGWHDAIIRDHRGWLVKQSYAPGASRSGPPTNHGQAVRTPEVLARWVGLYETQSQESAGKQTFRIAIQSSHVAWKTIGTPKMGMLGAGVAQALGAKAARPDTQVYCIIGDGAMGFHPQEVETSIRTGLAVVYIVLCDKQWGMVKMNQQFALKPLKTLVMKSLPASDTINADLGEIEFDMLGRSMGAHGERVRTPDELRAAIARSLASGKCAVIHVDVDPVKHMWAPNLKTFKDMHNEPGA